MKILRRHGKARLLIVALAWEMNRSVGQGLLHGMWKDTNTGKIHLGACHIAECDIFGSEIEIDDYLREHARMVIKLDGSVVFRSDIQHETIYKEIQDACK